MFRPLVVLLVSAKFNLICPKCGKERAFSSKYSMSHAAKVKSACFSCRTVANNKLRDVAKNRNPSWRGYEEIPGKVMSRLTNGARSRGLSVDITLEDIYTRYVAQDRKCALTGELLTWDHNASVDRIDSTKGYSVDNIQIVSKEINMIKRNTDNQRFIELCKKVAANT